MDMRTRACLAAGLATASLGSCPAFAQSASADSVSIYGVLDQYVGSLRRSDQSGRTKVLNSGGMTTSYWGVRGTEDLGGGLQTFFALESFIQADTGTFGRTSADPYFSRNSYVGLGGAFGQLSVGRQTNALYAATGNFNPFLASANLSPVMLQVWNTGYNRAVLGDSVWDNTVQYTSPEVTGFRASASYGFGEVTNRPGRHNLNLTLNYANGPFAAAISAQEADVGPGLAAPVTSQKAQMAGLSYDFNVVKVYGQYFHTDTPDIRTQTRTTQLGFAVPVGAGRLMASVASTRRDMPLTDSRRTTSALGYDHYLSKRTDLYAVYLSDKLTGFDRRGNLALGVRHRF
ncbi:putative porin [Variovorax paradoxus]|uniref:porin n=1 Tax=Variovorax paradoxus TaxID=34073 RepID=UPI002791001A|nr:porin [Variovorax paradoxus]MDQ0570634.1 putative porin [Variovorax paradoxus]